VNFAGPISSKGVRVLEADFGGVRDISSTSRAFLVKVAGFEVFGKRQIVASMQELNSKQ
jgi:hypothetical protein